MSYFRLQKREVSVTDNTTLFLGYNSKYPLKILIHGWKASKNHISTNSIKNAYLGRGGVNLLSVDWSLAANSNYDHARYNIRKYGIAISKILEEFFNLMNIEPINVHILGHSLGAHIGGIIGKYFNGTIGRYK